MKYSAEGMNALAAKIHMRNVRLGFWDKGKVREFDGQMMNAVGELAEAQEEWRDGRGFNETHFTFSEQVKDLFKVTPTDINVKNYDHDFDPKQPEWLPFDIVTLRRMPNMTAHVKPEGIPYELADAIIRILDTCAGLGIDIEAAIQDKMAYNEYRPHRHGGKRS